MMVTYEGKCSGGPLDGRMLAHDKSEFRVHLDPVARLNSEEILTRKGRYRWGRNCRWVWKEEKEHTP